MAKEADQQVLTEYAAKQGVLATRLNNAVRGLADDCGEVNGVIKRWLEYQQPLDVPNLIEEVGDCLWRLAQICHAVNVDLSEVMEANLLKLEGVRYEDTICNPHDAAEENRNRVAEREVIEQVIGAKPKLRYIGDLATAADNGDQEAKDKLVAWAERFKLPYMSYDTWWDLGAELASQFHGTELYRAARKSRAEDDGVDYQADSNHSDQKVWGSSSNPLRAKSKLCASCATPVSDRAPDVCPECGSKEFRCLQ